LAFAETRKTAAGSWSILKREPNVLRRSIMRSPVHIVEGQPEALTPFGVDLLAPRDYHLTRWGPASFPPAQGCPRRAVSARSAGWHALAHRPHVAILDLGLPRLDGGAIARQLRATPGLQACLLIALTGHGLEHDRQLCRDAGFDHFLLKPVAPDEVLRLLPPPRH
jgi:CheY-like chemotaxis protein